MESVRRPERTVEFGIYRDGDNNLDETQAITLRQALRGSAKDSRVEFTVQDTTKAGTGHLHTDSFAIADGQINQAHIDAPHDMASEKNLAQFVAHVLDNAEATGAKQTWIELTDHGAGDGGGLEADSVKQIMRMPEIAQAIADGAKMHAQEHPEDAGRRIDGVVANQCLMASLGFADALSHAGVKFLAASPETMLSPGVPSDVADAIAKNTTNTEAMSRAIVGDVMRHNYGVGGETWKPAAAFDVFDLDPAKIHSVESSVKALNDDIVAQAGDSATITALREDARSVDGMVRFPGSSGLPWHADRPAIALYQRFAHDPRLDAQLRTDALNAETAVKNVIIAHEESRDFAPFDHATYRDAAGPTVHFPINRSQVDPWAPRVSETHNRFFEETDAAAAERVLA